MIQPGQTTPSSLPNQGKFFQKYIAFLDSRKYEPLIFEDKWLNIQSSSSNGKRTTSTTFNTLNLQHKK